MSHRYINVDASNVDTEHLCCALADKKHVEGVDAKRAWLKARFDEGLVFRKLDARAKVFIEYMPADLCWRPIAAPGWMAIHCLWVSGRYAGQGHARALLDYCKADTLRRGLAGIVTLTGTRKRPFLGHPKLFEHMGFERIERAGDFALWAWRHDADAPQPAMAPEATRADPAMATSLVARYTDQCPFNRHWAPQMAEALRREGCHVTLEHITEVDLAQQVASPLGTFSLESSEGLVAHHLHTDNAVGRLVAKRRRG